MSVRRFLAHKNSGKSRLFAVRHDTLEAVTTLGVGDVERTDDIVRALDVYLSVRDEVALEEALRGLPDAVLLAIRGYLRSRATPEPGTFGPNGLVEVVRRARFPLESGTIEQYLSGAYVIGLGIRVENLVDDRDRHRWAVVLLNGMPFVPMGGEARAWRLPDGSRVEAEWIKGDAPGRQVPAALTAARKAAAAGRRVRIHTYLQGDGKHWLDGAMTTSAVVDVFNEPPPTNPPPTD
ncbi:MAG TPA: hypothetical protein VNO31_09120 [Umezawaea sp.]|nr:hypothetical protein [Umezawaea sp.]